MELRARELRVLDDKLVIMLELKPFVLFEIREECSVGSEVVLVTFPFEEEDKSGELSPWADTGWGIIPASTSNSPAIRIARELRGRDSRMA